MKIKYGAYTFPIMPTFQAGIVAEFDAVGRRIGTRETWPTEGWLAGTGQDDLNTKWNALKAAMATDKQDLQLLKDDDTVLQTLLAADCNKGPRITDGPTITEPRQGAFSTNIKFSITFQGFRPIYIEANVVNEEITYSWTIEGRKISRRTAGFVETKAGISALTKAKGKQPYLAKDVMFAKSQAFSINEDDTRCDFTFLDESITLVSSKGGSEKASKYSESYSFDDTGKGRVTLSGTLALEGRRDLERAVDRIENIWRRKASYRQVSRELVWDAEKLTMGFSLVFESVMAGTRDLLEWSEEATVLKPIKQKRIIMIIGGRKKPIIQKLGWLPAELRLSGRAIGLNDYPEVPEYGFSEDDMVTPPDIRKIIPKTDYKGKLHSYEISWSYHLKYKEEGNLPDVSALLGIKE